MEEKALKKGHLSENQKKELINIMEGEEDLRKGKFNPTFTFKDAQKKWGEIADFLNSIPGAQKDWKEWRRTWQDLKKNLKKKTTSVNRHSHETGGGPPLNVVFTENDENLLRIMDTGTITGDPCINESTVVFDDFDHNYVSDVAEVILDDDKENIASTSKPNEDVKKPKENDTKKRKRNMAVHRLEESIKAQENFTKNLKEKMKVKTEYYEAKLELLRADVRAKERIAAALEQLLPK